MEKTIIGATYGNIGTVKEEMAALGWTVEECTSKDGYTIKFKRPDWHELDARYILGHDVCFKAQVEKPIFLDDIFKAVAIAARTAKGAWDEYVESIPYQTSTGEVKIDMAFEQWQKTHKKQ